MSTTAGVQQTAAVDRLRQLFRVSWPLLWAINAAPMVRTDVRHGGMAGWSAALMLLVGTALAAAVTMATTRRLQRGEPTGNPSTGKLVP